MAPYIVRISSQKGGVGKTTIAVNLAVALQLMGYKVLLADGDTVNPTVGFHLGLENVNKGMRELVTGKARLIDVRVVHAPTGLHVVPGALNQKEYIPTQEMIRRFHDAVAKTDYNFVIVDTMPGYTVDQLGRYYDEALIVSTPEMASVANAVRLKVNFDKMHLKHSLVLNKVRNKRYELHQREIEEMYEDKILQKLPDDEVVPLSIEEHIPAYIYSKRALFSKAISELVTQYAARSEVISPVQERGGFFRRLFGLH